MLMLIPEDTELPPDYVQEWQYLSNWIDINCELSLSFQPLIVQAFLGIPILLKANGGLEENLRCILCFIANSRSDAHSKV